MYYYLMISKPWTLLDLRIFCPVKKRDFMSKGILIVPGGRGPADRKASGVSVGSGG